MFAEWLVLILQILYTLCTVGLAVYSLNALWLVWQARRARPQPTPAAPAAWPAVTVQLPLYNERHVAERLIDACARLDYPADKLEIQVLDDSDDATAPLIDACAQRWQQAGRHVRVVRRTSRTGYKAGALAHALPAARGEFIAIFDADFLPPPAFLRATLPHFYAADGDNLAFVQARWEHLNRDYSPLTRGQALALDGHFAIEQAGRQAAGYMLGFNGSAGVWRRAAIEDPAVGGWQQDTLCEDLDLSYRAQLAGWRARYCNELEAPAEIPPQLAAYKRQQFRWAKGSIQTLRKLGGRVWRSARPPGQRIAGLVHLGSYLDAPAAAAPAAGHPADPAAGRRRPRRLPLVGLHLAWPAAALRCGQMRLHRSRWWRRWLHLPLLTLLGHGRLPQQHAGRVARAAHARRRIPAHAQVSHRRDAATAGAPAPIGCPSTA
jgi:cellulose synthase/poly-beta-1,6-N-acetylglucosamine synthase-like glycosyltransferase